MIHTKHIWRVVIILGIAAISGFIGRHFLIPPTFGAQGFFRNDALAEHMAKPVIHGSATSCTSCHAELSATTALGKHAQVSCETCHAPLSTHANETEKTGDMPSNKTGAQCALCHELLRARPDEHPQIVFSEHLVTLGVAQPGETMPEDVCYTCHDPHSPALEGTSDEQLQPQEQQQQPVPEQQLSEPVQQPPSPGQ